MASYYVNKSAQPNGDHEVHKAGCSFLPGADQRIYLGDFARCQPALKKAGEHYRDVNGCYYCSKECHTG